MRLPIILTLLLLSLLACKEQGRSSAKKIVDYESARRIFWDQLYPDGGETLYCAYPFDPGYNKGINIEHVFPMGWVGYSLDCGKRKQCRQNSALFNEIEADLHNLYPASSTINKERSSIAFGMINGEKREFGKCDFEVQRHRPRLVEPREEIRGDVARAMFYMADTYDLTLFDKQIKLLRKWHKQDPPDAQEHKRNQLIESIQGNRNKFIDGENF